MAPLKERWVTLQFQNGLDTETSELTVPLGHLTRLENAVFDKRVTLIKRPGTRVLGTRVLGTPYSSLPGAQGLTSRMDGDDLVMLSTDDRVLSYESDPDAWSARGPWVHTNLALQSLPNRPNESWDPASAAVGDQRLVAWEDGRGGVFGQLMSVSRGGALSRDFRIGGTLGRRPQVVAVGNSWLVLLTSGSDLYSAAINAVDPGNPSVSNLTPLTTQLSGSGLGPWSYDAVPFDNTVCLVGANTSGSLKLGFIKATGFPAFSGSSPFRPSQITGPSPYAGPTVAVSPDNALVSYVWQPTAASGLSGTIYNATNFAVVAQLSMDADTASITANPITRMTSQFVSTVNPGNTGYALEVLTEHSGSARLPNGPADNFIRRARTEFNNGVRVGTPLSGVLPHGRHSVLASRQFNVSRPSAQASNGFSTGSDAFAWLTHISPLQTTDFCLRTLDGLVVAASNPSLATPNVSGVLPNVDVSGTTGNRTVCARELLPLPGTSGSTFSGRHLAQGSIEFRPPSSWQPVDVDGCLYFPGGWLGRYDGTQVTELGFRLAVEGVSGSVQGNGSIDGTGGIAGKSTFEYAVVPEWTDARGNQERGAVTFNPTFSVSAATASVILTWPSIVHTMKDGTNAPNIRYGVYRTGPNGTVLQRVDNPGSPILNSTGSDFITFTDTVSEAVRASGEECYLDFEAENLLPNSPTTLGTAGDRLYAAGLEGQPNDIAGSKLRLGSTFQFTEGGGASVDAAGGPITRLYGMDGNVVVFKRTRAFGLPAGGPSNASADNTPWPSPVGIVTDTGVPPNGVVIEVAGETVQGLMFWSALRGARLMDRGLSVSNIGALMKGFNDLTVVGGLAPRNSEDARLYTAEGMTLSLNTHFDQWSTFPNQSAAGATTWQSNPTYAVPDGRVYTETPGLYLDGSTPYSILAETGWIPLSDSLQGLARVWELFILGTYYSPHRLLVEMAFDYRDSYVVARTIDTTASLEVVPYGGLSGQASGIKPGAAAYLDLSTEPKFNGPMFTLTAKVTGSVGNSIAVGFVASAAFPNGAYLENTGSGDQSADLVISQGVTTIAQCEALIAASSSLVFVSSASLNPNSFVSFQGSQVTSFMAGGYGSGIGTPSGSFGSGSYGVSPYGGADPVYQFRVAVPSDRCQAVRFRFSDLDQQGTGQSFSLTELKLRVGVEKSRPSLPTRKGR